VPLSYNDTSGEVALINADTDVGISYLEEENNDQVKIILAERAVSTAVLGFRSLERPVSVHDLVNALSTYCKHFSSRIDTASATATIASGSDGSASVSQTVGNNTPLLLHEFISVHRDKTLIKLECAPYHPLYINGISGTCATRASLAEIHIIAKETESRPVVTEIDAAEELNQATSNDMVSYPIGTIIWQIAMVGANGTILPNHSLDTAVKLKSLPRFPREYMRNHPEFLKLSGLILKQSMTIRQLQQATQLDIEVVTDFYNLVFSLGLSSIDKSADSAELYKKKNVERESLLSRLAKKLISAA